MATIWYSLLEVLMKKHGLFLILIFVLFSSCVTQRVILPDDYLPEDKVVYLKQKVGLEPLHYSPLTESPFEWDFSPKIDPNNMQIYKIKRFKELLAPNPSLTALLYEEISFLASDFLKNPDYVELKHQVELIKDYRPDPLEELFGDEVERYSNAITYNYPPEGGALISKFSDGTIKIDFKDGRSYVRNEDGFFLTDSKGDAIFSIYKKGDFHIKTDEYSYYYFKGGSYVYSSGGSKLSFFNKSPIQDLVILEGLSGQWTVFYNPESPLEILSVALFLGNDFRIDYLFDEKSVLLSTDREAVGIGSDYIKVHSKFDSRSNVATDILSVYLPEGLRILDLQRNLTHIELNPQWPQNYKVKKIGGFSFLYVEKDREFLDLLELKKLLKIPSDVAGLVGFKAIQNRAVILPPDLKSYSKLFVSQKEQIMHWYPSGFQTKDYIVMWPPSVPRYKTDFGKSYFWQQEFYEILVHEYTHLAIGEVSGLLNPLPVWLNEGLAVYVESSLFPDVKHYWETTFIADKRLGNILPWEDVTMKGTSEFLVAEARTHYAQSYSMVNFLIAKYGAKRVASYVRSFRQPFGEGVVNLSLIWKSNFTKIFKSDWSENLAEFNALP